MGSLYVIRHGESEHNAQGIVQGPRIDGELSPKGRLQAQALGLALAGKQLDAVYSSPMIRARQTAEAIIAARGGGLAVNVLPELYEMDFGSCIGQPVSEVRPVLEQVIDAWSMGFPDEAFPGGESAQLAFHRIRSTVTKLVDAARSGEVAVVAHGRINRILIAAVLGQPLTNLESYPQSNASITTLRLSPDGASLEGCNDVAHLQAA